MTRSGWILRISCLALALGFAACGTPALQVDGGGGSGGGGSGGGGPAGTGAPDGGRDVGVDLGASEVPSVGPSCGDGKVGGSLIWISAIGLPSNAYDGPAVVERSTSAELLLAFDAPNPAGGGTDALPRRATIGGLGAKLLPVGATVWLTKDPAVTARPVLAFGPPSPWTFSVRDKQGGRLLFGAAFRTEQASPIPFGNARVTCETAFQDYCVTKGTLRHSTFDFQGDTTVTIGDGETRIVRQGGVDYDVNVWAQEVVPAMQTTCYDYLPPSGFAVTFVAHDLAGLVTSLAVGPPPSCGFGNVDAKTWSASLTGVDYQTPYEGPVTFEMRDTQAGGEICDQFGVVGLTALTTTPPKALACASPGLAPAPAAGQELWLSRPSGNMAALRQSKNGPLIAASVSQVSTADSARLGDLLGTKVEVRQSCAWAVYAEVDRKVLNLREVVFGMTPSVVVKAGEHAVITLGGQQADVWLSATSEPFLTVAAR